MVRNKYFEIGTRSILKYVSYKGLNNINRAAFFFISSLKVVIGGVLWGSVM